MPIDPAAMVQMFRDMLERGVPFALVTIILTTPAHSRKLGMRLFMDVEGAVVGHLALDPVSRHVLEQQVRETVQTRRARLFHLPPQQGQSEPWVEPYTVFIEPAEHLPDSWIVGDQLLRERQSCVVATELDDIPRHYLLAEEQHPEHLFIQSHTSLHQGVLLERWEPPIRVLVAGENSVADPLLDLCRVLGYQAERYLPSVHDLTTLDARTALVVARMELAQELQIWQYALQSKAGYLASVSGRSRSLHLRQRLHAMGVLRPERIYAPAGLNLGDPSPAAMALSIVAEFTAVFNRQDARSLNQLDPLW